MNQKIRSSPRGHQGEEEGVHEEGTQSGSFASQSQKSSQTNQNLPRGGEAGEGSEERKCEWERVSECERVT